MEELFEVFGEQPKTTDANTEKSEETTGHEFHSQHLMYAEELWNSLDSISLNSRRCTKSMKWLIDFLKNLTKQAEGFSSSIGKIVDGFEKEIRYEGNANDTTGIWISGLPGRVRTMNEIFASHVKIAQLQSIEALENFHKAYQFRTAAFLTDAQRYRADLRYLDRNIDKSQSKYYKMWKKREKFDKEIERGIHEHEKGNLTFAQVQK